MLPLDRAHRIPEGGRPLALARGGPRRSGRCGQPQGVHGDARRLGEEGDPLHQVRQLPDVARPGIGEERRARVGGESLRAEPVIGAGPPQEVLRQEEDVRRALGEGGEPHGHDGEPVIEVLAETAGADRVEQVLARRRDQRDVGGLALRGAEPPHRLVLEDLQELGLDAGRQEAHLVEEERAAVGRLEETGLGLTRIGEGPALEAEQLGLEEGVGNRGAVDLDERSRRAGAGPVQGAREEPLARAGLPQDQERRKPAALDPVREDPPHRIPDGLDCRTLPEQLRQGRHGGYSTPAPRARGLTGGGGDRPRAGRSPARPAPDGAVDARRGGAPVGR